MCFYQARRVDSAKSFANRAGDHGCPARMGFTVEASFCCKIKHWNHQVYYFNTQFFRHATLNVKRFIR
jgi:hypothetical protein